MPRFIAVEADAINEAPIQPPEAFTEGSSDIDPRKVVLPNHSDAVFKVTVASGTDDQLADQLLSSLRTIQHIGETHIKPFKVTEEGLAPRSWHAGMEERNRRGFIVGKQPIHYPNYSNVLAAERRVRAIRAEQVRRAHARRLAVEQKVADERARHEAVLAEAPKELARLISVAEKDADAFKAVAALASAIEVASRHVQLSSKIEAQVSRAEEAAKKLGVEPPELPEIPDVPVDAAQRLFDALMKVGVQRGRQGIG